MWPNGPFATPVGSFIGPVPPPGVDPLSGGCSIIRVNPAWLPYIRGALSQLLLQTTWDTDEAGLAIVTQQANDLIFAFNDIEPGDCSPQPPPVAVAEMDYDMSICEQLRWNNGVLEGLCCGVWTPIDGQGVNGPPPPTGQPGAGSGTAPAGGGHHEFCGTLGRGTWLVPQQLNSGDTLLFTGLFGAWQDNRDLFWHCPDGFLFVLDVCGPTLPHGSPDPVPGGYHMQLIIEIDGTFYDCLLSDDHGTPTTFTVPAGHTNATATVQANIDNTDLINGEVEFCVQVTNNQIMSWSHTWDFRLTPGPWSPLSDALVTDAAVWTAGLGWAWTDQAIGGGIHERIAGIQLDPIAFNMGTLNFIFDRAMGTLDYTGTSGQNLVLNVSVVDTVLWSALTSGVNESYYYNTPTAITTRIAVQMGCANNNSGPTFDGSVVITSATITGTGTNPFSI